jgi:hypothetical protein
MPKHAADLVIFMKVIIPKIINITGIISGIHFFALPAQDCRTRRIDNDQSREKRFYYRAEASLIGLTASGLHPQ